VLTLKPGSRKNLQRLKTKCNSYFSGATLCLLGIAAATACAPASTGGNDPNALYGSQAGMNTFIVSHVFNADVYEKQLGFALPQAPELSTPDVLLQCFYELQLTDQEMNQCARSTGMTSYSNPTQNALSEQDIWRLMILQQEKTAELSEFVVPQSTFNIEVQNDGKSNSDLATIARASQAQPGSSDGRVRPLSLTESAASNQFGLANTAPSQLGLVDLGKVLNPTEWFRKFLPVITTQFRNSATCLTTQTTQNPITLASAVAAALNLLTPSLPIVSTLGAVMNFFRPAEKARATVDQVVQACGTELVRATKTNAPAETQPSPQQIAAIQSTVTNNDPEALKRLLKEETVRQIESIKSSDFNMKSTLKESANTVPGQSIAELRGKIRNLSIKVGTSLNGARCLPAKRFVAEVLRPVLLANSRLGDNAASLDARSRCNVTNAAEQPIATPTPQVKPEVQALAIELQGLIAEVPKQAGPSTAEDRTTVPSQAGSSTTREILAQYKDSAPSSCSGDATLVESIPAGELADRLKTCSGSLGASDSTHTFGKFSDALRRSCAAASTKTSLALATCFCSCRWSTPFFKYLTK
jgi:hypothetical protein